MPNFFDRKNAQKGFLVQRKPLRKNQEVPRILSRNPIKSKKRKESLITYSGISQYCHFRKFEILCHRDKMSLNSYPMDLVDVSVGL